MDWGLYSAIRTQDNWAQRRQDKAMNLAIVEKQAKTEQLKGAQSMAAEEEINKYFDEMASMDTLIEDQGRIQEVEKSSRANIIKGIAQNNGDLSKYMSSGGISELHEYKNSILQSEEVQTAKSNKESMHSIIADKKKGDRWFPPVEVETQALAPDGSPKVDAEGNPIKVKRMASIDDQMALFRDGQITRINYNGSEKKVKMNPMTFKSKPKNGLNPYSKDNIVTASNIVFEATQNGASKEYANKLADDYVQMVNRAKENGQDATWKWGNLSEEQRQLDMAKLSSTKNSGGSKGTVIQNQVFPALKSLGNGKTMSMGNKDYDFWNNNFRIFKDPKTGASKSTLTNISGVIDADGNSNKKYDLNKALSYNIGNQYVSRNGVRYVLADAIFPADNSGDGTPADEGLFYSNKKSKDAGSNWSYDNAENFGLMGDEYEGVDAYSGQVLIPIEGQLQDSYIRDEYNKFRNISNKQDATAASVSQEDIANKTHQDILDVMNNTGVTYREALAGLISE